MSFKQQMEKSLKQIFDEETHLLDLENLIKIQNKLYVKINLIRDLQKLIFIIKNLSKPLYKRKLLRKKIISFYLKQINEINMTSLKFNEKEIRFLLSTIKGIERIRIEGKNIDSHLVTINQLLKIDNSSMNYLILRQCCLQPFNVGNLGIDKLKNLISLDLSYNNIGDGGMIILANLNFTHLKQLNLSSNNITYIGADYISSGNMSQLTSLNLSNNKIIDTGTYFLSNGNLNDLISLNLKGNNIQATGVKYLAQGNLEKIKELDLSNNKIDYEGAQYLEYSKMKKIQKLILSNNNIGKGVKFINNLNFINLNYLDIVDNNLKIEYIKEIFINCLWRSQLEYLDLSQNFLGPFLIQYLIEGKINKIKTLKLGLNRIEDEGVKFISLGKENFQMLENLDLTANGISDEGIKFLCLEYLKNLRNLNLCSNKITDQGLIHISNCNLEYLTSLNLSCNKITIKSFNSENFKKFSQISYLNFFGSNIKSGNFLKKNIRDNKES